MQRLKASLWGLWWQEPCVCHWLLWMRNSLQWMWTHSLSRQSGLWTQSSCLPPGHPSPLCFYEMFSMWNAVLSPLPKCLALNVTFSKFWDGNRLVNVNMCIREWCESILHFSGPTHRMFLHFLWTWSFSSRKNFYSWLLICSGHMIA